MCVDHNGFYSEKTTTTAATATSLFFLILVLYYLTEHTAFYHFETNLYCRLLRGEVCVRSRS